MDEKRDKYLNRPTVRWITYRAVTMCMKDWARNLGISYNTLWKRLNILKWSIPKALTTPVMVKKNGNH